MNSWILTSGEFKSVLDFEAVVRNSDPNYPTRHEKHFSQYIGTAYDYDHVHLNPSGYAAVTNSINLRLRGVFSAGPAPAVTGSGTVGHYLEVIKSTAVNGNAAQLWTCNGVQGKQWEPQANGSLLNP